MSELTEKLEINDLSADAVCAMMKGSNGQCPGCLCERKIPTNVNGGAEHYIGGRPYQCHAGVDAWATVPEFIAQVEPFIAGDQ